MTLEFGTLALFSLFVIGQVIWVILRWQRNTLSNPNGTAAERDQVGTLRIMMLSGAALTWAIALVRLIWHPALLHQSQFFSFAMLPLLLTSLAITLAYIAPLRATGSLRSFMLAGYFITLGIAGTALAITVLMWSRP